MRSVVVAWLRVALPLTALVLLSTLFLLGRKPDPEAAIPYATVDAEDLIRDPRMTRPEFAGVSEGGAEVTLNADRATPAPGNDGGSAEAMRMTWRAPDGLAADLTAPQALMEDQVIHLSGGVRVTTSDGWALSVPQIDTDLATDRMTGTGGLVVFSPLGQLNADAFEISRDSAGDHVLNLTGDVRLIYQP
ncbi:MAG: hypothetical protein Q4G25_01595 [Paracoccus sp. (in: a-proteobacteria)]|nr:hypothetical protein [Paracoccus sp. (in: a-proteobacteria)]